MEKSDPYIDSNTGVLKNLLNIKDNNKLKQAESDIVITRIHEIFKTMYFESSKDYFLELHKYLFSDVYSFAGKYRTIEIYKQERVLAYESVEYAKPSEIDYQLNEIFEILRNTDLLSLDIEMQKDFVTSLISDLWKVHPFREGNTRTCLVFLRTYLNSYDIKFDVNFFKHENTYKYMRDALVASAAVRPLPLTSKLVASAFESDIYEKEREYKYLRRIIGDIIELDQERKRKL